MVVRPSPTVAFKEWAPIVGALLRGEQLLLLRKGGIAEGRDGFQPVHAWFWLFPTQFHVGAEKLKSALSRPPAPAEGAPHTLPGCAEVVAATYLREWNRVQALDAYHGWSAATLHERFHGGDQLGLHALVVRVYRAEPPLELAPSPRWGGCRSWLDLDGSPASTQLTPVHLDTDFKRQADPLLSLLAG